MERLEYIILEEVEKEEGQQMEESMRYLAVLSALIGCQGMELFRKVLPHTIDGGLTPEEIKEIVYQSADWDAYQPLAFRKLFRGLLYPRRA